MIQIGGLQKTSMLDFPGKLSAVVFTQGCNFFCPYCHNPDLVLHKNSDLAFSEVLSFLNQRRNILEGVVISGGEPTLHAGLMSFCLLLKNLGYAVKLDTNGSNPNVLEQLLQENVLDYVAMDIKANPLEYPSEICSSSMKGNILKSIDLLAEAKIPHEFRVPCVAPFITKESFLNILECIHNRKFYEKPLVFLQEVKQNNVLEPSFFSTKGHSLEKEEIVTLQKMAEQFQVTCCIR